MFNSDIGISPAPVAARARQAALKTKDALAKQVREQPAALPENFATLVKQWEHGNATFDETLVLCGMCRTTFYKYLAQWRLTPGAKR